MVSKKIIALIISFAMTLTCVQYTNIIWAEEKSGILCDTYCLVEADTGTVLMSKNDNKEVSPASITKIMTLIIICERIDKGELKLTDTVTTSAHAKSMGGSQVFLEEGEIQSVEDMIKCIVISSGNDASVAMAEHIAGSEEEFVKMMNSKAKMLGMQNTNFVDCCGLTDSDEHYTSAKDVAIMSRELIKKHPYILDYSSIWMDKITHVTKKGESEFILSNTNKLLKMNSNVVGLKTGSTSKAGYCVSAVAKTDKIALIAVIMNSDNNKTRFEDANKLIKYGLANCKKYSPEIKQGEIMVKGGKNEYISYIEKEQFNYLLKNNEDEKNIKNEIIITNNDAPIKEGDVIGNVVYTLNDKKIGQSSIVAMETVEKAGLLDLFRKIGTGMMFNI